MELLRNFPQKKDFQFEFYYLLPEKIEKDFNINFRINNIKEFNGDFNKEITEIKTSKFKIKVFVVEEKIIEILKNDENIIYSGNDKNSFEGKYETGFGISKIIIKKDSLILESDKKNYIYILIDSDPSNNKKFTNINGELNILEINNIDYFVPNNVYLNGNLDKNNNKNEFKIVKKNENDKIIRVELSSSEEIYFSISLLNFSVYKFLSEVVDYDVKKGLGKKYIDINVELINKPLLFTIYHENLPENKNIFFSFKYRNDEGIKIFKNFSVFDKKDGLISNKWKKEKNKINLYFKFPSIIEKENLNKVNAKYYLKIYKYNKNQILVNNTICVIDNVEPIFSYEYNFEVMKDYYEKELEIENYKNEDNYYATLTAIVIDDDEFVSYKSFIFKEIKKNGKKKTFWIVFIVVIIILIIIGVLIFLYYKKYMKNDSSSNNSADSIRELSNIN